MLYEQQLGVQQEQTGTAPASAFVLVSGRATSEGADERNDETVTILIQGRDGMALQAVLSRIDLAKRPGASCTAGDCPKTSAAPRRLKFLVVDDYDSIRDVLQRVLADMGDVDTAENGARALLKTRHSTYDVILCDVDMPVMNGMEFFSCATRENPESGDRFVFFTGSPTPAAMDFFAEHRVPYLTKPSRPGEIRALVAEVLKETGHGAGLGRLAVAV